MKGCRTLVKSIITQDIMKGYTLKYRHDAGEWRKVNIDSEHKSYNLEDLKCGSTYHMTLAATNVVGTGKPSSVVTATTKGGGKFQNEWEQKARVNPSREDCFMVQQDVSTPPASLYTIQGHVTDALVAASLTMSTITTWASWSTYDLLPGTGNMADRGLAACGVQRQIMVINVPRPLAYQDYMRPDWSAQLWPVATVAHLEGQLSQLWQDLSRRISNISPKVPLQEEFLNMNSTSATLYLEVWPDGGCPIKYFEVKYRPQQQSEWVLVSGNAQKGELVIPDLFPATWYIVWVTAHNDAGSSEQEFLFATRTHTGAERKKLVGRDAPREQYPAADVLMAAPSLVERTKLPGQEIYMVKLTLGCDSPPLANKPPLSKCPSRSPNVHRSATRPGKTVSEHHDTVGGSTISRIESALHFRIEPRGRTQDRSSGGRIRRVRLRRGSVSGVGGLKQSIPPLPNWSQHRGRVEGCHGGCEATSSLPTSHVKGGNKLCHISLRTAESYAIQATYLINLHLCGQCRAGIANVKLI
ncbi:hypothetical protein PR048_019731 [Dryococelus australis]|uniref:Fibronectin type-III domain-containing protein n=1 Tax=Dryococelus australis TaxID=614101 RepID=A0ABQ9H4B6_9NEOP|nr:hypothetical protein PR048_019731 [Dryococelus australis]